MVWLQDRDSGKRHLPPPSIPSPTGSPPAPPAEGAHTGHLARERPGWAQSGVAAGLKRAGKGPVLLVRNIIITQERGWGLPDSVAQCQGCEQGQTGESDPTRETSACCEDVAWARGTSSETQDSSLPSIWPQTLRFCVCQAHGCLWEQLSPRGSFLLHGDALHHGACSQPHC